MRTTAIVLCDSIGLEHGVRVTTLALTFPRIILAQFNTHRAFSRNAASSRAIRTERLIEQVETEPYTPARLCTAQRGMVAGDELDEQEQLIARAGWAGAARAAVKYAKRLASVGLAKEHANRVLEPFLYAHVIVTATDWRNFFKLRLADDAQPEIQELAQRMSAAMAASEPRELRAGEWHIPYITEDECKLSVQQRLDIATARCACVSYRSADGEPIAGDRALALTARLRRDGHWSPFEHSAMCKPDARRIANLRGYTNYRTLLETEQQLEASEQLTA